MVPGNIASVFSGLCAPRRICLGRGAEGGKTPGGGARSRPGFPAEAPRGRRGGRAGLGGGGSAARAHVGRGRLGAAGRAAGRAGPAEKRVGAGEARGARARRGPSCGRRRELRRRQRGRVASGATSAARGRRRRCRQPSLLAPQLEEAPPEPATARGCASRSGRLSSSCFCPLLRPAAAPRGPRPRR